MIDEIALVFSIIAVIISIIVACVENRREYNINKINLEAEYFSDIYKEHLIVNIPNARRYITFDMNGKLIGTNDMIQLLQKIMQDSYYYFYKDKVFYDKLQYSVQALEDYLCQCVNKNKDYVGEEQTEILKNIQNYIKEIYESINNQLIGK